MAKKMLLLRLGSISLVLLLALSFAIGCTEQAPSAPTAPKQTAAPAGQPIATPQQAAAQAGQPVKGGTLRIVNTQGPQVLGYHPEMGPVDASAVFPAVERIMDYTDDRVLKPFLAKTVVEDPEKLTMTFTLNQGIMFTDGTELTADVAAWWYQQYKDVKGLNMHDKLKSVEVVDKYTFVLHLNDWNNQLIQSFGWVPMFSKEAFEKNGGKEWARTNVVATGPFKLQEFKRDVSLTWVRNENYWRKGLPNLDRIEVRFIPEATTTSAMMQSGEADIWVNASAKDQAELQNKGFIVQRSWPGLQYHLMPNTMAPDSKWNDIRLRQAVEYALDKPAITKAIGYGIYQPLTQVAPPGEWGHDPSYPARNYDPAKAKQLLADAGYASGFKTKLLAVMGTGGRNEAAEAIKGYLDAVGIETEIDIADPGRFYGSVFGKGWEDLALMFSGTDVNYLVSASRWWGPEPMTNLASMKRSPALVDLFKTAMKARSDADQKAATAKIVKQITDDVQVIPVYHQPAGIIISPRVHTNYPRSGFVAWDFANTWIDKK